MRRIILPFFMVVILLALVSCSEGSETMYLDNAESGPNTAEIEISEENRLTKQLGGHHEQNRQNREPN